MTALTLFQSTAALVPTVSFPQLVRALFSLSVFAGFVMFFRPLLTGIFRALVLAVRPRPTRQELAARRHLRDARLAARG